MRLIGPLRAVVLPQPAAVAAFQRRRSRSPPRSAAPSSGARPTAIPTREVGEGRLAARGGGSLPRGPRIVGMGQRGLHGLVHPSRGTRPAPPPGALLGVPRAICEGPETAVPGDGPGHLRGQDRAGDRLVLGVGEPREARGGTGQPLLVLASGQGPQRQGRREGLRPRLPLRWPGHGVPRTGRRGLQAPGQGAHLQAPRVGCGAEKRLGVEPSGPTPPAPASPPVARSSSR